VFLTLDFVGIYCFLCQGGEVIMVIYSGVFVSTRRAFKMQARDYQLHTLATKLRNGRDWIVNVLVVSFKVLLCCILPIGAHHSFLLICFSLDTYGILVRLYQPLDIQRYRPGSFRFSGIRSYAKFDPKTGARRRSILANASVCARQLKNTSASRFSFYLV
jgi:hypothetical protein